MKSLTPPLEFRLRARCPSYRGAGILPAAFFSSISRCLRLRFLVPCLSTFLVAQDADEAPEAPLPEAAPEAPAVTEADQAYERFRRGTLDVRTLAEVLPQMADPERRPIIRSTLLEAKTPPRPELVSLLQHPTLAVRLGSLELLEELAGGDLSYNPWLPADSPENHAAFARWKTWVGEPTAARGTSKLYSKDQRRGYLRDLLGDDADKGSRARRMLETEGLSAVGFLETFLAETPTLPPGGRAKIREAQYQITLTRQLGDQAAVTARHLAFGSRDQLLSALSVTRSAGQLSLPILRDFITHPDPLVRETAIDSLLISGGDQAVPIVAPLLAAEADVNVIHGALRRLKDIPGPATEKLVASFLTYPDEDLLVSTIQTCLSLGGRSSFGSSNGKASSETTDAILRALADPRWRVRAAALEYVAKTTPPKAKDPCLALLEDPDQFVRFAAIKAIAALGAKEALPKLKAMFLADESMAGPVIEGYGALKSRPDAEFLTNLDAASTDAKLAALRAVQSAESLAPIIIRYTSDANIDVACAALRHLASDDDGLKTNEGAAVLVTALRSDNPGKIEAILERLALPPSGKTDPIVLQAIGATANTGEPTALDLLYDAFVLPGAERTSNPAIPKIPAAQTELIRELVRFTSPETPAGNRFLAALNLARAGQSSGYTALLRDFPSYTTAQKTTICERLYQPSNREAIELLGKLLRDPVSEVRSSAANSALSEEKSRALIQLVLDELAKPDALLQPHEVYDSRFESAAKFPKNNTLFRTWCLSVLEAPKTSTPLRVLATIAARNSTHTDVLAALKKHTAASDPNLRRAAWHALISARPAELTNSSTAVAADKEAFVREVLPNRSAKVSSNNWNHRFSDTHVQSDNRWTNNEPKTRLNDSLRAILDRLATKDPSPLIRFEASFALLTQGVPTDLESLAALVPRLPKDTEAPRRIARWLDENAARATPALSPLLSVIPPSSIQASKLKILHSRIQPKQTKGFATFASLAESTPAADGKTTPLLTEETDPETAPARTSIEVAFFYKPGCPECIKAKQELTRFTTDFPLLKITEHNILEASGTVFNQALCARFSVPSAKHTVSPAVFTQSGFLIRDDIAPRTLAELLAETMAAPQDDTWTRIDEQEQQAASKEVDRRYEAFTLPVVIGAGLLDGLNPCAFATIIFFLSYLQIARRTPREMLMVGAAFISAVFIAYLAAGLLLHELLGSLNDRFAGLQTWMNFGFGGLALVAAFLSFRDAFRARGGRMAEMTLQLPGILKDRIRGVVRTGARARNFVAAAFVSGLLISLLELACTGQVYAPIIYQIQRGKLDAVLWLVIYNLAFILPLIVIFLLAYGGLRSETLVAFQKKHTGTVKTALGILFLILALFILFGRHLLGS